MAKLNIIFHGTFVFSLTKEEGKRTGYIVKVPEIGGHQYRAGNWLGEVALPVRELKRSEVALPAPELKRSEVALPVRELKRGEVALPAPELKLVGAEKGEATLDPNKNVIVKRGKTTREILTTITLPMPEGVSTPRCVTLRLPLQGSADRESKSGPGKVAADVSDPKNEIQLGDDERSSAEASGPIEKKIGALQIFTYEVKDVSKLKVTGLNWEPAVVGGYVNLHFFAAHEHHGTGNVHQHVKEAFDECMAVSGCKAKLDEVVLGGSELCKEDLPPGVLPEETEGLESRTRRMAQMGRMWKEKRDLNLLWFDSESLDSDPDACTDSGDC
ncbi:MAG: hypothetical protein R2762_06425 [Bryobacteraceae bacterium]